MKTAVNKKEAKGWSIQAYRAELRKTFREHPELFVFVNPELFKLYLEEAWPELKRKE